MILTSDYSRVAATYTRMRSMLKGLDSNVNRVGFITAWNPIGERPGREANEIANERLLADLRDEDLGPIKIGGHFQGVPEGSFLIPNISRKLLVRLCGEYNQESVVYGQKFLTMDNEIGFQFELLDSNGRQVASKEMVVLTSGHQTVGYGDVSKQKDNFSFKGGDKPRGTNPPKTRRPGWVPPSEKRVVIPFQFTPDEEEEEA